MKADARTVTLYRRFLWEWLVKYCGQRREHVGVGFPVRVGKQQIARVLVSGTRGHGQERRSGQASKSGND